MRTSQNGNVVIFILLAVGLFGALAFSFTRGGQQGQGNMNQQQAKIIAQNIINYGTALERATDKLLRKGCSESQINLENSSVAAYVNPNAPIDKSCNLFDSAGGGIAWRSDLYDLPGYSNDIFYSAVFQILSGITSLDTLDRKHNDLAMYQRVNEQICVEINRILQLPTEGFAVENQDPAPWTFTGFNTASEFRAPDDGETLAGIAAQVQKSNGSACYKDNPSGFYLYYHILIAR